MSTFLQRVLVCGALILLPWTLGAQQVTNGNFEDWSAAAFNGEAQPKGWNASNVEQVGMKFNFAHKEAGHNGGSCMMVQDQSVGAMGITETSPGYFAIGKPWAYLPSITEINKATAGTSGGQKWTYRPDTMSVWIKRTGSNWEKEDFYLLYYSWSGTAIGDKYKGKNGDCTKHQETNEESDIRQELNGNECGTTQKATQIAEGMWRERKSYGQWTNIRVPIYYFNSTAPTMMNIIFSASNYPNYRANSGLYEGNSLYVDDVQLIYSSKIHQLFIDDKEWKGFDPNSSEIQTYSLGENATTIPALEARRGAGKLSNAKGKTVTFAGRILSGKEIKITYGDLEKKPTRIVVYAEDNANDSTVYQIQFQRAASKNAKLAGIAYVLGNDTTPLPDFSPAKYTYNVELPYGTTIVPKVAYTLAEDGQTAVVTDAAAVQGGKATIVVTAPDKISKETYTLNFTIGLLKDNTLKDILVNGKSLPGFSPAQTVYKVSLADEVMPAVQAVSAYPDGEQTIEYSQPATVNGGTYLISVKTPGNQTAKVYKLNLKVEESSYSMLADLRVTGDQIANVNPAKADDPRVLDFSPDNYTYFVNLQMGTKTLPQIEWTKGDDYQTVEMSSLGEGVLDGTVRITVTAGNHSDQSVYKLVFTAQRSEISTLNGILIDGVALEGFTPDETNYTVTLPVNTSVLPIVQPVPGDEYQTISITYGGLNGKTRITVIADDGTTKNYYITFKVATYTDNTLADLTVAGYSLQDVNYSPVAFDPTRNEYWVKLDQEATELPAVTAVLQNAQYQDTTVMRPATLNGNYKITVRPINGASRTYTIHFIYKMSDNTALKMIYIDGDSLPNFNPENLSYTFTLDTGTVDMPTITWDVAEAVQTVTPEWDKRTIRLTVLAGDKKSRCVYKVKFIIPSAAGTQLKMIYLDGDSLAGFKPDSLDYKVSLAGSTCPKISVDQTEGQRVTITAPYAAGTAVIKVTTEESSDAQPYTIEFEAVAVTTALLDGILVNGVALDGFQPATMSYEMPWQGALPTVEAVKASEDQTVTVLWKGEVAYLHIRDAAENKAVYSLAFTLQLSSDNSLAGIYANDVMLPDFNAQKRTYAYELAAGSTYPEISYKAAGSAEVIFFGQLAEGKWGITVEAENGDTTTYTVQYHIAKYNDATLLNMSVDGYTLAFDADTYTYALTIDDGASLPEVTVETRPGQTVMQTNVNDTLQQVVVYAEGGATRTYSVTYTRISSSNALLADILIDGVSIEGFDPYQADYTDFIPWRSKFVPNVFPVAALPNQTITTYFCQPGGVTRIHVEAQDGSTRDYSVAFPVRKSDNTFLGDLYLDSEDAEIKFKATQTEYEVILPYEADACPKMIYEKAEDEQRIDVISNPIGRTSQIIVIAENGDTRTYNILFKREVLKTKNLLASLRIKELDQNVSLKDKTKRDFDVEMPYGSRSLTIEYEKSYDAQTVFVQPGGVKNPTIITVKANNDTVPDEIYTINPIVPTADPAVLTDIKVNGTTIPGFNPEKFSYIVEVTEKPILRYTLNKGAEINITYQSTKHWQAEVTYGEGTAARTNTYNVWYYYKNEQVPNMNFANWEACATLTSAQKPSGWNTLADVLGKHTGFFSFTPSDLCKKNGSSLELNTQYSTPGGGLIPGFVTLGTITTAGWGIAGGTVLEVSGGISFHNSPDVMSVRYKFSNVRTSNQIQYILTGGDGQKTLEWKNTSNVSSSTTFDYDLTEANTLAGDPTLLNIVLNSYFQTSGTKDESLGLSGSPKMIIDWISFSYNHTLTGLKVDAINATMTGNAFSATLKDPERIELPVLSFTGEVADQAQNVTWKAPTKDANYETRTATIRNFAENGTDYTDYTLTVKRPLDTKNQLAFMVIDGDTMSTFNPATTDYTLNIPAARRNLPDIQPVPGSSLQTVTTVYNAADSTVTITVTPEKGEATVYTVKFTTKRSSDTTLKNLTAEGLTYDPEQKNYQLTAAQWPLISFDKQSDLQIVSMVNGLITVTAEDGTTGTYTITRVDPTVTPMGILTEFNCGTNVVTGFGNTDYSYEKARPADYVSFIRQQDADSVIFIQSETQMKWYVPQTGLAYTWTYPTTQSANTHLAGFTVNGVSYAEFMPDEFAYELVSDTSVVLAFQAAEQNQQLTTTITPVEGGVRYTTEVKAENGATDTYTVSVTKPQSNIATLAGILLDSVLIDGFDPAKTVYTVVLPAPVGAKTAQPKMPNITYAVGHPGQIVTINPGALYVPNTTEGADTEIEVTSEDGSTVLSYSLIIKAEPSHCSDLTGITVNGEALDHFEPGRHFYSTSIKTEQMDIDYTTADRFQTVQLLVGTVPNHPHEYHDTLRVTAEDGSVSDYLVEIYIENRSNDAQLANILLNNNELVFFRPDLNPDMKPFDPGKNEYHINIDTVPQVSAQLKMDGQSVEIESFGKDSVFLHVWAVDSTHNVYKLYFEYKKSTNTDLSMIYLDGDSLPGFRTDSFYYAIDLKIGATLPKLDAEAAHDSALVVMNATTNPMTVTVYAEDRIYKATYTIAFNFKKDDVHTLEMIYENGYPLPGFKPDSFYYERELPVGTLDFPSITYGDLEAKDASRWPYIDSMTVALNPLSQTKVHQTIVTSESEKKSTYTITYTIRKSDVDTLQMITVNNKQLPGFRGDSVEYKYQLTAAEALALNGEMPEISCVPGDEYQDTLVLAVRDISAEKTLGYKHVITATAASGKTRVYTIQYPVELSSDATLNMILLGGEPLANYDSERFTYKLELGLNEVIPVISVLKKEELQTYDIIVNEDVVEINVWAEDTTYSQTYTLTFDRVKSATADLTNIIITENGKQLPYELFYFDNRKFEYDIVLPYDSTKTELVLPDINCILGDEGQEITMQYDTVSAFAIDVVIRVVAPNGEDEKEYRLSFTLTRNNDAYLKGILLRGEALEPFGPTQWDSYYKHPFGAERDSAFFKENEVVPMLSDPRATYVVFVDEDGTISIVVTAQDEKATSTYKIYQSVGLDSDNTLKMIYLDGDSLEGFDPEVTFYTFMLKSNATACPTIEAEANSVYAEEVSVKLKDVNDTTIIICTAQDKSEKRYYIYFKKSLIDDARTPSENDVLIRRVPGASQLFVATVRKDVTFVLYDQDGHLLFFEMIPDADPNNVDFYQYQSTEEGDHWERQILNNVNIDPNSGLIVDVLPGQIYFYSFLEAGSRIIKSGKIMSLQ